MSLTLQNEKFMEDVTHVLHVGRREGARRFFIAGDLNIQLGLKCTDEGEKEEMQEMYGPQCWHGIDGDLGGLKKTMWLEVVKEFNCKAVLFLLGRAVRRDSTIRIHPAAENGFLVKLHWNKGQGHFVQLEEKKEWAGWSRIQEKGDGSERCRRQTAFL